MVEATPALAGAVAQKKALPVEKKPSFRAVLKQHWMMYVMLIPAALCLALFHYYPLWGISIAFVKFNPVTGMKGSPFVGFQNFEVFFGSRYAWPIIRNTITIAVGKIFFGQLTAILFALLLNEVRNRIFKRSVQTITTLPNFLSWVLIGGIMSQILARAGLVNVFLTKVFRIQPIPFLGKASIFPWTMIFTDVWKGFGWGAVIYLAALTNISPELYEAAAVDGAGRFARLIHITLPGISSTIVLMSCLALGGILNAGFEQILVLYNPMVYSTGDIIDTYVFRVGLVGSGGMPDFSLGTAVGLFKSVIGFFLIMLSYWLADKFANYRIF